MKALIDGDILVYRSAFSAEKKYVDETGRQIVVLEPVEYVLHSLKNTIQTIVEKVGADEYQVYLTGSGNFREEIATIQPYKGNRTSRRPIHYTAARDYLVSYHGAEVVEGQEADDAMSIEQHKHLGWSDLGLDCDSVICTIDKDLDMVPGNHYNWVKDKGYFINEDEAMANFYHQMLTGDSTDNILGISGVGPKTAQRILASASDPWCAIGLEYAKMYADPEAAMRETADLLWMKRHENDRYQFPWEQGSRIDVIGQNGNDGEHYE